MIDLHEIANIYRNASVDSLPQCCPICGSKEKVKNLRISLGNVIYTCGTRFNMNTNTFGFTFFYGNDCINNLIKEYNVLQRLLGFLTDKIKRKENAYE